MARELRTPDSAAPLLYWGADVPLRVIRRFAEQVAERFHPDRIVLFGSHAYGTPDSDSDVDILVVVPTSNPHGFAARIRAAIDVPFPMDLIVRTPHSLAWRLAEGESFHTEILSKGKVLHEMTSGASSKSLAKSEPFHRSINRIIVPTKTTPVRDRSNKPHFN